MGEIRVRPEDLENAVRRITVVGSRVQGLRGEVLRLARADFQLIPPRAEEALNEFANTWAQALGRTAEGVSGLAQSTSAAKLLYELTDRLE